jgi:hypothetical protein
MTVQETIKKLEDMMKKQGIKFIKIDYELGMVCGTTVGVNSKLKGIKRLACLSHEYGHFLSDKSHMKNNRDLKYYNSHPTILEVLDELANPMTCKRIIDKKMNKRMCISLNEEILAWTYADKILKKLDFNIFDIRYIKIKIRALSSHFAISSSNILDNALK